MQDSSTLSLTRDQTVCPPKLGILQESQAEHKVWDTNSGLLCHQDAEEAREEDEEDSDADDIPDVGPLPSVGSQGHVDGTCKPCAFITTRSGCRFRRQCGYCHYPHERKRQQKPSKKIRERCKRYVMHQEQKLDANPDAIAEVEATMPESIQGVQKLKAKLLGQLSAYADTVRMRQRMHGDEDKPVVFGTGTRHIVAL